jgi:glycosyltransferase involved in cell wall biosynthesis
MRVIVITNMYPSDSQPFFGSFVKNQVLELQTQGIDILVVAKAPTTRRGLWTAPAYLSLFLRTIFKGLLFRPDIIHSHYIFPSSIGAIVLKTITRTPLVITSHRGDVFDTPFANRAFFHLTKFCINNANLLIAVSADIEQQVRTVFGCTHIPIKVLDMGFRLPPGQAARFVDSERLSIIFIGLSFERKGGHDLLQSIERIRTNSELQFRVSFVGEFPKSAADYVERNGLTETVNVLGKISHEEISRCLQNHDIFVLPSYSEGLPVSMLEAMATGLAVIGTPVGDVDKLIGEGAGILVEPGDVEALTDAITSLLSNSALRKRIASKGVETATEYTSNRKATELVLMYEALEQ